MGKWMQAIGLSEQPPETPVGDYSADVQPPAADRGPVTAERAATLPPVYRAIQMTSTVPAQLTLSSWRNGSRVEPTPSLLEQPDPWMDLPAWIEYGITCGATDGNAFLYRHRAASNGQVVSLEHLDPTRTHVQHRKGRKFYQTYHRGEFRTYTEQDVKHIWFGLRLPGLTRALGPVTAFRAEFAGALDLRDYAAGWFNDTDTPSGVLSTDQALDAATAKEYKRRWINPDDDDPDKGRGGPRIRVLGKGLRYDPVRLNPADALWLDARSFSVVDIARMFGMPPEYLAAAVQGSGLTYRSLAMISSQWLDTALYPIYLKRIESALTAELPRGQVARFDAGPLRRLDEKAQAEVDRIYLDTGVIARQTVADRLGTGPVPDLADVPKQQQPTGEPA